ncbi:MAG: ABC transporter substrate-binding protein [Chloroflexota bacterium]|nr:ABC transporter substrate-binding protein [Chloroflexota bacterium]
MAKRILALTAVLALLAACGGGGGGGQASPGGGQQGGAAAGKVTLKIESWRSEDLEIWQDKIIPAFEKAHSDIHVEFTPTAPDQYDPALRSKLEGGTAGDLIVCRPFDLSLKHFQAGFLTSLNDLPGLENFDAVAKSGWSTDDGKTTFCVPMASVIHGFIYNADAFAELGLQKPTTEAEFFQALDKIKASGKYTPLALGTVDTWTEAAMGFNNIGPNYWKGEEGRLGLIKGTKKFSDPQFTGVWETLRKWAGYMPSGFEGVNYSDTQNLFTIGKAAVFPAGSWEITGFKKQAGFKLDAFRPPVRNSADQCYISDHIDIAIGMNAKTKYPKETRTFLEWVAGPEFASLYSNALPGFFSLSKHQVKLDEPLAQEFLNWRNDCKGTIRVADQILSRGEPSTANEIGLVTAEVLKNKVSPQQAGERLQKALDGWYKPK